MSPQKSIARRAFFSVVRFAAHMRDKDEWTTSTHHFMGDGQINLVQGGATV